MINYTAIALQAVRLERRWRREPRGRRGAGEGGAQVPVATGVLYIYIYICIYTHNVT